MREKTKIPVLLVLFLLFFISCSKTINEKRGRVLLGIHDATITTTHHLGKIKVLYTGCGGLFIGTSNHFLITDPFYTAHSFGSIFGEIAPLQQNTKKILDTALSHGLNSTNAAAVLVSHSHYDHLEDLPALLKNNQLKKEVKILGSPTTYCVIRPFTRQCNFEDAEMLIHRPRKDTIKNNGNWLRIDDSIRVLPILSSHAPHFYGIHMMRCKGKNRNCCPQFQDTNETYKKNGFAWKEGSTYSFLIDFFQGTDTFRVFVQSSASKAPDGFPPKEELNKHPIDLAILCMASFKYVKKYPNKLIPFLNAKHYMIIHWENFFADFLSGEPKSVPGTNPAKFYKRILKIHNKKELSDLKQMYRMPIPQVMTQYE